MEYCSNGDLGGYIKRLSRNARFAEEDFVWAIFAQLISALYLCHTGTLAPSAGQESFLNKPKVAATLQRKDENHVILHRDLKPENVFLTNGSTVKLGDFGLSRVLHAHDFASTYVGTPFYMSPELCSSERYSAKSDIWSLGCIIYELCAKDPPFNGRSHIELAHNIRGGNLKDLPAFYSKELRDVVRRCLKVSQDDRPDVAQLLQEPMIMVARLKLQLDAERETYTTKLKLAEEEANVKVKEAEKQIEMEWHAKATLAITQRVDERVEAEKARLWKILEEEKDRLSKTFEAELEKRCRRRSLDADFTNLSLVNESSPLAQRAKPRSSEFTNLSLANETSPLAQRAKPRKSTRIPFTRAKTIAHLPGSPMDISPVKQNRFLPALTPSRKAPQAPRSALRGRTLVQLAQSPAKWGPELGEEMPSPFLKKGQIT